MSSACRRRSVLGLAWPWLALPVALALPAPGRAAAPSERPAVPLEEIVVTASLRGLSLADIPASATVLTADTVDAAGLQHLGDLLGLVPNLNWSGGTSRPRFFQLRGIGELEQYQGAPNPSVGFLIDDIDLSGVGMPATSFDVQQVEVLRGPQGTRFGANALAGLIKVNTRRPSTTPDARIELMAGGEGTWSAGAAGGGPLGGGGSAWRLAAQRFASDGFQRNRYLGRDDTNGRDETTLRGRLELALPGDWQAGLAGLYVDLDNGFDAFAPDNSRNTLTDRPGRDAQRTAGTSLRLAREFDAVRFDGVSALARSDSVYSFDGDWGNDPYWGEFAPYDYFSRYDRERATLSQDLRWSGRRGGRVDWSAGLYGLRLDEDSTQRDDFAGEPLRPVLLTEYSATTLAAYGEAEWQASDAVALTGGLRVETRDADYRDSTGASFAPRDTMAGGSLSLHGPLRDDSTWYATVSRGFKAGGFNIGARVPAERREFAPEYLWNAELGWRYLPVGRPLQAEFALFHMWREDQQVATSFQLDPGDPLSYVFYTDNAARGRNYGLEASASWQPAARWNVAATLGLLQSEYLGYRYGERDLDGRAQAHAPEWQYSVSAQWGGHEGWMLRADLSGSDAFYFDASHDQRSEPYALLNLKAGYGRGRWSVQAWVRNATDEVYAVRGFYFGLEPPDFASRLYVQRGDARLAGVTLTLNIF